MVGILSRKKLQGKGGGGSIEHEVSHSQAVLLPVVFVTYQGTHKTVFKGRGWGGSRFYIS